MRPTLFLSRRPGVGPSRTPKPGCPRFATRFVSIIVPMVLVAGCCATLPKEPEPEPVIVTPPPPKIGGIGAKMRGDTLVDGTAIIVVDKVVLGSPAEGAGIANSMILWTVDGQPATDLKVAVPAIRGPVGTPVTLEVGFTREDKKAVVLTRAEVDSEKLTCEVGDCQNGTGAQLDAFGDRYQGGFQNGRFHGQGRFVEKSGRIFEGSFVEGYATGPGVVVMADGNKIEGEFKGGYVVGKAKRTAPNGDLYEGEFRQFQADGQGVYTRPYNKDTWTGTFVRASPGGTW